MPIDDRTDGDTRLDRGPWITSAELRAALASIEERLGADYELHKSANGTGNLLFASTDADAPVLGVIDLSDGEVTWW